MAIADRGGASTERLECVRLAVSEALTTAVERGDSSEVHVRATVFGRQLAVLVAADCDDTPGMGFGLALIAACSDDFVVGTTASGGVQIEMRFDLDATDRPPSSVAASAL